MDLEEDEDMSSDNELLQRYLTLDKKVGKTKQQVKSVVSVLEKQTKLLAAISTKIKLDKDERLCNQTDSKIILAEANSIAYN